MHFVFVVKRITYIFCAQFVYLSLLFCSFLIFLFFFMFFNCFVTVLLFCAFLFLCLAV